MPLIIRLLPDDPITSTRLSSLSNTIVGLIEDIGRFLGTIPLLGEPVVLLVEEKLFIWLLKMIPIWEQSYLSTSRIKDMRLPYARMVKRDMMRLLGESMSSVFCHSISSLILVFSFVRL